MLVSCLFVFCFCLCYCQSLLKLHIKPKFKDEKHLKSELMYLQLHKLGHSFCVVTVIFIYVHSSSKWVEIFISLYYFLKQGWLCCFFSSFFFFAKKTKHDIADGAQKIPECRLIMLLLL